jgi:hypothetical protein
MIGGGKLKPNSFNLSSGVFIEKSPVLFFINYQKL